MVAYPTDMHTAPRPVFMTTGWVGAGVPYPSDMHTAPRPVFMTTGWVGAGVPYAAVMNTAPGDCIISLRDGCVFVDVITHAFCRHTFIFCSLKHTNIF